MEDAERFRLLGKYRNSRFRIGQCVFCEMRGEMVITGVTDAPIPWPVGKNGRSRLSLIINIRIWRRAIGRQSSSTRLASPAGPSARLREEDEVRIAVS